MTNNPTTGAYEPGTPIDLSDIRWLEQNTNAGFFSLEVIRGAYAVAEYLGYDVTKLTIGQGIARLQGDSGTPSRVIDGVSLGD